MTRLLPVLSDLIRTKSFWSISQYQSRRTQVSHIHLYSGSRLQETKANPFFRLCQSNDRDSDNAWEGPSYIYVIFVFVYFYCHGQILCYMCFCVYMHFCIFVFVLHPWPRLGRCLGGSLICVMSSGSCTNASLEQWGLGGIGDVSSFGPWTSLLPNTFQ